MALITRKDLERDYLTVAQIAAEFSCAKFTVRRWIDRYFDKSLVEISGDQFWVHRSEVARWRSIHGDKTVKGRRLRELVDYVK